MPNGPRYIDTISQKRRGHTVWCHYGVPTRGFFAPLGTKNTHVPEGLPAPVHHDYLVKHVTLPTRISLTSGIFAGNIVGLMLRIAFTPRVITSLVKGTYMRINLECAASSERLIMSRKWVGPQTKEDREEYDSDIDPDVVTAYWYYKEMLDTRDYCPLFRERFGYLFCMTFENKDG